MTVQQIDAAIGAAKKGKFDAAARALSQHELHMRSFMKNKVANNTIREQYGVYNAYLDEAKKSLKFKRARLAVGYMGQLKVIFNKAYTTYANNPE